MSLEKLSYQFQNSSLLIGISIIIMNIGGSYISKEIPDYIEEIFDTPILRRFFIFIVVLIYTKDIGTSILVTLLFIIMFSYLLNKKSRYCILSEKYKNKEEKITKKHAFGSLLIIQKYLKSLPMI
jgi:hypothetical protein|tara:strand:- start:555 stop:929 length:375 start_codon:yes stop_codon:yes gene_type:complete